MKFYGKKIIELAGGDIHLHYANNRGRGTNNVTLTVVPTGTKRPDYTREYGDFLYQTHICGWRGNVNIPNRIIERFGGIRMGR